jgi:hypothetical protein
VSGEFTFPYIQDFLAQQHFDFFSQESGPSVPLPVDIPVEQPDIQYDQNYQEDQEDTAQYINVFEDFLANDEYALSGMSEDLFTTDDIVNGIFV